MTTPLTVPVVAVGVCGSDRQRRQAGYQVASLGHELVGRRPTDGALVAIRPLSPCRTCAACKRGWTEQCPNDVSIGRHDTGRGGFSGHVQGNADQLYPLPIGVSAILATLADPLACVLHAVHGIDLVDANVLVIGDGPMAAIAAVHMRQTAGQVTIAVKSSDRGERIRELADQVATAEQLAANQYDVVLEAVGGTNSEAISTAVTAVAPLGRVVALGVYPANRPAVLPLRELLEKESTLRGSKAYRHSDDRDDFAAALQLLSARSRDFAPIIAATPTWSPDDPRPAMLDYTSGLKIVYLNTEDEIQ